MNGWHVDGYTEVRELGRGGQGRVVLARNDASGAPVAIKYLAGGADEADRERMRHEARMLARADSPHVARLYRLVERADGVAIIMEAVDGVSLKELLARNGALGPEASLAVLKGSLLGLAAAHALGVVHEVLPLARLSARAWEIARELAKKPPMALRYTRAALVQNLKRQLLHDLPYGLALEGLARF